MRRRREDLEPAMREALEILLGIEGVVDAIEMHEEDDGSVITEYTWTPTVNSAARVVEFDLSTAS